MNIFALLPYSSVPLPHTPIFRTLLDFYTERARLGSIGRSLINGVSPEDKASLAQHVLFESRDLLLGDQAILLAIVHFESGFNPSAKNPRSSAYGLFQVVDATWKNLGMRMEDRSDIFAQIRAGVSLYRENLRHLGGNGNVHGSEKAIRMYTLHHDGLGGKDLGGERLARKHIVGLYRDYANLLVKIAY